MVRKLINIKLKEDYTEKEKELIKIFNINIEILTKNIRNYFQTLLYHLYFMVFLLIIFILIGGYL